MIDVIHRRSRERSALATSDYNKKAATNAAPTALPRHRGHPDSRSERNPRSGCPTVTQRERDAGVKANGDS